MGDIKLSPSSYNDLKRPEACPRKWEAKWVSKTLERDPPSLAQQMGSYFEYHCIGGGARPEDNVTELPLTKTGKVTADQVRIDQQVQTFKNLFDPKHEDYLGITIIDTQKRVENDKHKGYYDMLGEYDETGELIIIDLKLTKSITSSFSYAAWSKPEQTDTIQLPLYKFATKENVTKLAYLVFDYSPDMNILFREVELSDLGEVSVKQELDEALDVIKLYQTNGWLEDPSQSECATCSLVCKSRFKTNTVIKDKVII